jgi:hypothetical protein
MPQTFQGKSTIVIKYCQRKETWQGASTYKLGSKSAIVEKEKKMKRKREVDEPQMGPWIRKAGAASDSPPCTLTITFSLRHPCTTLLAFCLGLRSTSLGIHVPLCLPFALASGPHESFWAVAWQVVHSLHGVVRVLMGLESGLGLAVRLSLS